MKKSILFSVLVTFSVFILSGCTAEKNKEEITQMETKINQEEVIISNQEPSSLEPTPQVYTLEQVAEHATQENCWIIVDDTVVDATSFFGKHPGGDDKLLKGCGKDASEMFAQIKKHTPEGYEQLKKLKIGIFLPESSSQLSPIE
ncbi:MAG: cytochrome b5 domain-containing protein [Candidatus Moraniibacteriota bacterium]|nr:MAG: cytochrome b5 domain-containing protein [Candidatus Moranbacteria bacterium]